MGKDPMASRKRALNCLITSFINEFKGYQRTIPQKGKQTLPLYNKTSFTSIINIGTR